jgi:hypothetical protein
MGNGAFAGITRLARRGIACMAAAAATGCAINPMVAWTPPQDSPPAAARELPASYPLDTMEGAHAHAQAYKRALHAKAQAYVNAQIQLNDALLGLGLLTAGTLASTAHADVPKTLAFLFGGSYLYGQQNLGKPRLEVYQSGIGATNCAMAAAAPLNFSISELGAIQQASADLAGTDLPALAHWLSASRTLYGNSGITNPSRMEVVDQQLAGAAATYQAGLELLHDTSQLPGRVSAAAAGLKGTVDEIAAAVDKVAGNTVVDPSSIVKSLGTLAGIVGGVAPGAGFDAAFAARAVPAIGGGADRTMKSVPGARSGGASVGSTGEVDLGAALAQLGAAQARVEAQVRYVGGRIATSKAFGNGAAASLKACGVQVSDAILALRVQPASVEVTRPAGDAVVAEVHVSGGAKNYTGRFLQAVAGVELIPPRAGEGTFLVKVTKDAPAQDLTLRIEDSSNPPQATPVTIRIKAAATVPAVGGGTVRRPAVIPPQPARR